MFVDRARDGGWFERAVVVSVGLFSISSCIGEKRRAGEPDPELRRTTGEHFVGSRWICWVVFDQLQSVVSQRKETDMVP